MTTHNTPAIVQPENVQAIIQQTPAIYEASKVSRQKCLAAGHQLLQTIESQPFSEQLDQQAAAYIEKARNTAKKINANRTPLTKLFDEVRKAFTTLENDIDPTKQGSLPYQVQQHRNAYAAKLRAEQEAKQREALARQQAIAARQALHTDITEDLKQQFQAAIDKAIAYIQDLDTNTTLHNYEATLKQLQELPTTPKQAYIDSLKATTPRPECVTPQEHQAIEAAIKQELLPKLIEQYHFEVSQMRTSTIDRLPSKHQNLLQIQQANAEQAAQMQAQMQAQQQAEAERIKAEREQRQEQERQQAEAQRQLQEMNSLFSQQATIQGYQPKTKVTKRIELLNPEGILPILQMWWGIEGHKATTEELHKIFKKQITACEKAANRDGLFIEDESVNYIDEVKAK